MHICIEKRLREYILKCKWNLSGGITSGFILFLIILYILIFAFMSMYLLWCTRKIRGKNGGIQKSYSRPVRAILRKVYLQG